MEKYTRTAGNDEDGLYCYMFSVNDSIYQLQPSGAANLTGVGKIEMEFNTIIPPLDPYAQSLAICDPEDGGFVGVNKPTWRLYDYNYDLTLFEEIYNIIHFTSGNCGIMFAT